jgi:hypothetical protein
MKRSYIFCTVAIIIAMSVIAGCTSAPDTESKAEPVAVVVTTTQQPAITVTTIPTTLAINPNQDPIIGNWTSNSDPSAYIEFHGDGTFSWETSAGSCYYNKNADGTAGEEFKGYIKNPNYTGNQPYPKDAVDVSTLISKPCPNKYMSGGWIKAGNKYNVHYQISEYSYLNFEFKYNAPSDSITVDLPADTYHRTSSQDLVKKRISAI